MTDPTRLAAVEAVASAALKWWGDGKPWATGDEVDALMAACAALANLSALSSAPVPAVEVVTWAVWRSPIGTVTLVEPHSAADAPYQVEDRCLGTVTLPIARVATGGGS